MSSFDVIYIAGPGRSGSTILQTLLASNKTIHAGGELCWVLRDVFIAGERCSCGKSSAQCQLWREVQHRSNFDDTSLSTYQHLIRAIEHHFFLPATAHNILPNPIMNKYQSVNEQIINAIRATAGGSTLVDSSKYCGRALALYKDSSLDTGLICITRSASSILASMQKENKREQEPVSFWRAAIYFLIVCASLKKLIDRWPHKLFILDFERFADKPLEGLSVLESWSGLSMDSAKDKIKAKEPMGIGHVVTGNRLRKKGEVVFQKPKTSDQLSVGYQQDVASWLERYRQFIGLDKVHPLR